MLHSYADCTRRQATYAVLCSSTEFSSNGASNCCARLSLVLADQFFNGVRQGLVPDVPVSDDSFGIEHVGRRPAIDIPRLRDRTERAAIPKRRPSNLLLFNCCFHSGRSEEHTSELQSP